jgi:beta-lactamase class A
MSLENNLSELQDSGCQYAFYYRASNREPIQRANCERFSSASIIKVPILLAWLQLEHQGLVDRNELCCLDDEPEVHGAGFSWLLKTRQIPYHDVLLMMISLSDNLCTNLVIRRAGLDRLERIFHEDFKLSDTSLQRKLLDFDARARGLDNWIGVQDCIRFYELIRRLDPADRKWVDSFLAVCQDEALLLRDLPRDEIHFHHKTGSIQGVLHDWGYTRDCEMFLLTQSVPDETRLFPIFGKLGRWLQTGSDHADMQSGDLI